MLSETNTAADAFHVAAGGIGLRIFGIVLWSAGLTSVIGASYTSISFVTRTRTPERTRSVATIVFILVCAIAYGVLNKAPQALLIFAGAFNGIILPIGFTVVLIVTIWRRDLLRGYAFPRWLRIAGIAAWVITLFLGYAALSQMPALWG